mgnify:CR=1 FL=1
MGWEWSEDSLGWKWRRLSLSLILAFSKKEIKQAFRGTTREEIIVIRSIQVEAQGMMYEPRHKSCVVAIVERLLQKDKWALQFLHLL